MQRGDVRFGGITALDEVSLDVGPGEVVGVIGPNGAGKTTLFNLICGFVRARLGTLTWRGRSLDGIRPDRLAGLGIARTLQGVGLFERLTVLENVMAGAERFRRARLGSALLGLPMSDSRRARAARARPGGAAPRRLRRNRGSAARDAPVRGPEARRAGAGARLRAASCCCSTSLPAGSAPTS